MDTATAARERAAKLESQVAALSRKRTETETALANDHAEIRRAAGQRATLVAELVGAKEEVARRLHRQIDDLDGQIRVSERMAEGRQKLLEKLAQESRALEVELRDAQQAVAAEEQAAAFEAFKVQVKQRFRSTAEHLDGARMGLGEINMLLGSGVERFGVQAALFFQPLLDAFRHEHANPEAHGWRLAVPGFTELTVHVSPMKRA